MRIGPWANIDTVASIADIKVPIPAGWMATGEFRSPVPLTDCYLHQDGVTVIEAKYGNQPCLGPRVILKRIVPPTLSGKLRKYTEFLRECSRDVPASMIAAQLSRILDEFDAAESTV